ncbi:DUF6445 family protein [Thermomonas flagellata]|uniref:DUF6445 family protein n=1 Tax=Thermomonas flagellata TaxID=2888524 RepID=UPI001F042795|nr:DUF6445 family protein [Thermomonas flagellata]
MRPSAPTAAPMRVLPYRKPTEGRDYWVFDDVLPDPLAVRARCLAKPDWTLGFPHSGESWPGRRALPALEPDELAQVEARVRAATGAKRLWMQPAPDGKTLNHNCVQVVGAREAQARPHTDARSLCRYAGVLYLLPDAPADCGTSFYRQRLASGQLGGNTVTKPHDTLVDALGTRFVPPGSFVEDVRVPNRFNRLLVYQATLIHSATAYCGEALEDARMAAVFFWMA